MITFCFDVVIFENGIYDVWVTEKGAVELPSVRELEHRKLRFNEGGQVSLSIHPLEDGEQHPADGPFPENEYSPLMSGKALVAYCVDFYPILEPTGFLGESCFKWLNTPLPDAQLTRVAEAAKADEDNKPFWDALPFHSFERNYIIKSFYHDTAWNEVIRLPTLFDNRVSEYTRLKGVQLSKHAPDVVPRVYDIVLKSGLDDVTIYSWAKLMELRNTPVGQEFRDMLARVRQGVLSDLQNIHSEADVLLLTGDLYSQELANEVTQRSFRGPGGIVFSLLLNLVPAVGPVASTAHEIARYIESHQSWTTLLKPKQ